MKRDSYITIRLPEEMKNKIQNIARDKMWSISQTVYVILCDYFADDLSNEDNNKE